MGMVRVNITSDENITDHEKLANHPNVRKYLRFPWGYTLFEFYDTAFEFAYSPGNVPIQDKLQSEEIRTRLAARISEERKLLGHVFEGRPDHWQGNQFGLFLKAGVYRVLDNKKINWPYFGDSPGWESQSRIRVSGILRRSTEQTRKSLEKIFSDWKAWAVSNDGLMSVDDIQYDQEHFNVVCDFRESPIDACIGLFLFLTKTRKETLLEAVGFFDLGETVPKFYEVGGTRTLT